MGVCDLKRLTRRAKVKGTKDEKDMNGGGAAGGKVRGLCVCFSVWPGA